MSDGLAPADAAAEAASNEPRCSEHTVEVSAATCARCGRFCCDGCLAVREPPLCTGCAPHLVNPLGLLTRGLGFDTLGQGVLLALREWRGVALLAAVFALPGAALQTWLVPRGDDLQSTLQGIRVSSLYELVAVIGTQSMLALFIARAEGRALSLGGALREGFGNWGRVLGASILKGIWVFLFALLLLVPGLWKAVLLAFTTTAALRARGNALEYSQSLVRGSWFKVFGLLTVTLLAAYVPLIVLLGLLGVGSEFLHVPPLAAEWLNSFIERFLVDGLVGGVMLAMFYALHVERGMTLEPMRWYETPPFRGLGAGAGAAREG